jgi:tetratricopeptide (TPR) repeat protein
MIAAIITVFIALCLYLIITGKRKHDPYEHTFTVNGRNYSADIRDVNLSDGYTADLDRRLTAVSADNREWEEQFAVVMGHQGNGNELEKLKDIEGAISEYEQAVVFGRRASRLAINNYLYSAERLMILYRKRKEYDKEISLIQETLRNDLTDKNRSEFEYRLQRANQLKNKK